MSIHTRQALRPPHRRRVTGRADRGSVSVEVAVFVLPVAALMAMFAIFCARAAATRLDLNATAAAAARTASQARDPVAAEDAATVSARANLTGRTRTCQPLRIEVDTSQFHPGGQVSVTISCTLTTEDLLGLGLPGTLTGSATSRAYIDSHRAVSLGLAGTETRRRSRGAGGTP